MKLSILRVDDFQVNGLGDAAAWQKAQWQPLAHLNGIADYSSRCKSLYSAKGIYFLFDCDDRILTCTKTEDFDDIYNEDVVEVFLWPDEAQPLYFEYEISPLGVELPILVPNHNGTFFGWRPWHYEGERLVRRATSVRGGAKKSMARISGWMAEFFIPFALFRGLGNCPPTSGTLWRANMYRIDYDGGAAAQWAWSDPGGPSFHAFRHFGTMVFE